MRFGGQTVTFVTVARQQTPGYLGLSSETRTETEVFGCHFRPVESTEQPEGASNTTSELWKCTAPPQAAALAAASTGELVHEGISFRIVGPVMPKYGLSGTVHHVTIMARRQAG